MRSANTKRISSLLLAIVMAFGAIVVPSPHNPLTTQVSANSVYVIHNPYAHVNWNTFRQYKAGLHSHTTNSDGESRLSSMAETHWDLGYHIVAITDHSFTTPSPDRVPLGAMTAERIAQMQAGRGRSDSQGMIFVPFSNERSGTFDIINADRNHHFNTYWTAVGNRTEPVSTTLTRMENEGSAGLAHMNHIGRFTGAEYPTPINDAIRISNRSENYQPYVELFRNHNNLIGMEIVGTFDEETQGDKALWDNILQRTMPRHPVWGFANDDAHYQRSVGFAYNLMLMPSLSLSEYRYAKEAGAFFAFSRVDRVYDVFPGNIVPRNRYGQQLSAADANEVRGLSVPSIRSITVESDRITIDASNYDTIRWYANGKEIHRGNSLNLQTRLGEISDPRYVRATVVNNRRGVLYTQPFGIERTVDARSDLFPTLERVSTLAPITIPTGSPATEMGLRLPGGLNIQTRGGTNAGTIPATIIWDLRNLNYNPNSTARQTFTVNGTVRLNRVRNPNNVPLTVSIQVTAEAGRCATCPPVTERVWVLDYSRLTTAGGGGDAGTPSAVSGAANMRSLGNGTAANSYRPGFRRESGDDNPMTLVGSSPPTAFRWANNRTSRAGLNLEVGTVAGGTASFRNDESAFTPVEGGHYRLQFAATGTGELRVAANRAGTDPNPTTVALSSTSTNVSHTWTQSSGNVYLELNNGGTVNISNVRIDRIIYCDGNWCGACCSDYPNCSCGACEYCGTRPCSCRQTSLNDVEFSWGVSTPDINVNKASNDHLLVLTGLEITPCMIEADKDATLLITYTSEGNNSNRRISVWTDLSGTSNVDRIAFQTTANYTAEQIVISPERITSGARTATLTIPSRLLYRGGNTAQTIFVSITTDEGLTGSTSAGNNRYTAEANQRGGGENNEFARFASITLTASAVSGGSPPQKCTTCNNLPCRCANVPVCADCGERFCVCPPKCNGCDEVEDLCKCCEYCDEFPCVCPERCGVCDNILDYCDCGGLTIVISVVSIEGAAWLEIRNSDVIVNSTKGLVLVKGSGEGAITWRLPPFVLRPNETVRISASDNRFTEVLKRSRTQFTFAQGDVLRLVDRATGEELSRFEIVG